MNPTLLSQSAKPGRNSPGRLLLTLGLPLLLALAFLGRQVLNFDSIGWQHGFTHPLSGWDHLVTMLAVGIWAAQLRGRAIWMLPLAFVGVMSLGGLAGAAGLELPNLEGIILLSGAVFGVLISRKIRFNNKINVLIVAFFGFCHGYAHGQEISTSASLLSYTLGFMLATLLLHGAGILVAKLVMGLVAGLLTLMFSSAALAEAAAANPQPQEATAFAGHIAWVELADVALPQVSLGEDDSPRRHKAADRQLVWCAQHNGSWWSLLDNARNWPTTLALRLAPAAGWPEQALAAGVQHLAFRLCYPDINHTPGLELLSNGVGLTSPPLQDAARYAPPPSAFFQFSASAPFAFADHSLRQLSVFAHLKPAFIQAYPGAWRFTASVGNNNSFYLLYLTSKTSPGSLASGSIQAGVIPYINKKSILT